MDIQDKIWDDVLGYLAWKFKETPSGDMYIDIDEVIPELKSKYAIQTFESYVNETFGAITIVRNPDGALRQPDVKRPVSTHYTGRGTSIPTHWNNSPFLTGGYRGSAGGSFGMNPKDKKKKPVLTFDDFVEVIKGLANK